MSGAHGTPDGVRRSVGGPGSVLITALTQQDIGARPTRDTQMATSTQAAWADGFSGNGAGGCAGHGSHRRCTGGK